MYGQATFPTPLNPVAAIKRTSFATAKNMGAEFSATKRIIIGLSVTAEDANMYVTTDGTTATSTNYSLVAYQGAPPLDIPIGGGIIPGGTTTHLDNVSIFGGNGSVQAWSASDA
jgi:hypothetical protein